PYGILSDLSVYGRDGENGVTTLTLAPGVELRFNSNTRLDIGRSSGDPGALIARGRTDAPIRFTADSTGPQPGHWQGIAFNATSHESSLIEHGIVEYGGRNNRGNILIHSSSPAIRFSTIRNSVFNGISLSGAKSSDAVIACNTFRENRVGIYAQSAARPEISANNFINNFDFGLHNATGQILVAEGNWWGHVEGPDQGGDRVSGNVAFSPWLGSPADCTPPIADNEPPFVPHDPFPAHGAENLRFPDKRITLSWKGGDPNPSDTLTYTLFLGRDADSLNLVAEDLEQTSWSLSVEPDTTYFWRVKARDSHGAETSGPVWRFTTSGPQADLVVSHLAWDPPSGMEAGQVVNFTATIKNQGAGPASVFNVGFFVNGRRISLPRLQGLAAGASAQVSATWTAQKGPAEIEVKSDVHNHVPEDDESNNNYLVSLGEIPDTTPPEMTSSNPAHGAIIHEVSRIDIYLTDRHGGSVDNAATLETLSLTREGLVIPGTRGVSANRFYFTPSSLPLEPGLYLMTFTAFDTAGNSKAYEIAFTIKTDKPAPPVITGSEVYSGPIQPRPADNRSNTTYITLTGEREENTGIRILRNNSTGYVSQVASGSDTWSSSIYLYQGNNVLEVRAQSPAGVLSDPVWVDIFLDSLPPGVSRVHPPNNSFLDTPPQVCELSVHEQGSGFDSETSTLKLLDQNNGLVDGSADWIGKENLFRFTPSAPLSDGTYALEAYLVDRMGNASIHKYTFTVDTQAPPPPLIYEVSSPTHAVTQLLRGEKEAFAALYMNGEELTRYTAATGWEHRVRLEPGENIFIFTAKDRAGNVSEESRVRIVWDDIPPLPVNNLSASGEGNGTTVFLNWAGYDEALHGDIEKYLIFYETEPFTSISGLSPRGEVPAGIFTHAVQNLIHGTPYWFAVVAVDEAGQFRSGVSPVAARPLNANAPREVNNLAVYSHADRLVFTWEAPADQQGDFMGYKINFDRAQPPELLGPDALLWEKSGLAPASAHTFKIQGYNSRGIESFGLSEKACTWLLNPSAIRFEVLPEGARLSWDSSEPSECLRHYALYLSSEGPFDSTEGMAPFSEVKENKALLSGLANHETVHVALVAVNISGGHNPYVQSLALTPRPDETGPVISDVKFGSDLLEEGDALSRSGLLSLKAEDVSGVSRVAFYLNGVLRHTAFGAPYGWQVDIHGLEEGSHVLKIVAWDSFGNSTSLVKNIRVELALPAAPVFTKPANGWITHAPLVLFGGRSEPDTRVQLYLGETPFGDLLDVDRRGAFSAGLTLTPGVHLVRAAALNAAGRGPLSAALQVEVDTSLPSAPVNLKAEALEAGVMRLSWSAGPGDPPSGFNLYRSATPFTELAQAQKVNTKIIGGLGHRDMPAQDGAWFYRGTALNKAGNESAPSEPASGISDSKGPRARVSYAPEGPVHPHTQAMGQGRVGVRVEVNEPLMAPPFFSITPEGGHPLPVDLTKTGELLYEGYFDIEGSTPSGRAWAVFSARDLAGNRGTEIDEGPSFDIDAKGPSLIKLDLNPQSPIHNNESPLGVRFRAALDRKTTEGVLPDFAFVLSGAGRQPEAISSIVKGTAAPDEAEVWEGAFDLPLDAGFDGPELLSFTFSSTCLLGNEGRRITAPNRFQVYAGDLPPLSPPSGLGAKALPAGAVALSWHAVEHSSGYRIYRQDGENGDFHLLTELDSGDAEAFEDRVTHDGLYVYAITSLRKENGEVAESVFSASASVKALVTLPPAPKNLRLRLIPPGIEASWEGPGEGRDYTHRLYRSDAGEIHSVDGLTPLEARFNGNKALDSRPSPTEHAYVLTRVDPAGNESLPSNSVYLNVHLLPADHFLVSRRQGKNPELSWTHPGGSRLEGFLLSMGAPGSLVSVTESPIRVYGMEDTGFGGEERAYRLVAVDSHGEPSPARELLLPHLSISLAEGPPLRRGVMNHLFFDVKNHGNTDLEGLRVSLRLHDRDHGSEPFGLKAGEGQRVAVVVPGYGALKDREPLSFYVEQSPEPGLRARIGAEGEVLVQEGMLALTLRSEEMIRGGAGLVSFVLENTGEGEIELVTAKNFGNRPSEDIRFSLLDGDGNLLASIPFMQFTGEAVQTLANGTSLVRLGPGAVFTSAAVEIPVPGAAPERAVLKLEFDRIYHGFQSKDPLVLRGFAGTREVGLKETDYAAEILEASPSVAYGQDVRIRGRVFVKEDGKSLPHAPFNLVLMQNGFERKIALVSGSDGEFSYTFRPTAKESGVYQVAALHPDILDRPVQAEFTIARVGLHPSRIRLSLPKNYEKTLPISLEVAEGLVVNNLRLVKEDWDQPANAFEEGVFWDAGPAITRLEGGKKAGIPLKIHSDNRAADHGSLVLRLVSDEVTGLQPLGFVHLDISFTEAKPHLFYPNYKETGLVPGESLSEVLTFKNQGLADVEGLTFSLKPEGGKPLPDWVLLNRSKTPSVLGVGESLELPLTLAPPLRANEGLYSFIVAVDADNHESLEIPVFVTLTTRGRGHALFKVKNIYTGSQSADGRPIQGLGEASITLQNEKNLNIHFEKKSDDLGEALFTDLPAGSYKYRVRAPGHQEKTGRLWIRAGVTASEALFLEYNFVTVEWRVQETTIEDRYDIVLTLTYETDVPAPVVICDPTSVSLPDLKAGDVMTGEISCINHGLIRADNLRMNLPEDDAFIRYQLLAEPPESLGAKERISIPYRLVALRSLNTADEVESGGSGGGYGACGYTHYSGVAANGCPYSGSSPHCFSRPVRGSGSGGTSSGGGGGWWWGGGTGGSSSGPGGGSWTGSGTSIATQEGVCVPLPGGGGPGGGGPGGGGPGGGGPGGGGPGGGGPGGGCGDESSGSKGTAEPECGDCERMEADICGGYRCVPVGSSILPFTGEFVDGDTDLWVRAQGGRLGLVRNYSYGSWDFNIHSRIWPVFEGSEAEDTKDPARLFFNGYAYEKSGSATYTRGNYRILIHERDSSGRPSAYRYESSSGAWELFEKPLSDKSFGLSSWGNIHGVTARLVYNGEGQPSTLQDRHGEAMLFFTHDAAGRLTQAKDGADRRVNYVWSGELLTEVKDPMGESTLYAYDGWGRIHKITDPSGHTRTMAYDNNGRVHSVLDEKNQGHTFAYSYDALRQEYYSRTEDPDGSIREIWYDRNGRIKKTAVNGEEEKRYVRDGRVTTEIKGGARTKK
ncbi:YD repeat-containing protein, partial [Desulfobotulus alkaliphilus]